MDCNWWWRGIQILKAKLLLPNFAWVEYLWRFMIEKHLEALLNCFMTTPCITCSFNYCRVLLQGFSFFAANENMEFLGSQSTKISKHLGPLLWEYFWNMIGLLTDGINFHSLSDNNEEYMKTKQCDPQWGPQKRKNPYRYLKGLRLGMKSCIESLWLVVHQKSSIIATISLCFVRGILVEWKGL